MDKVINYKLFWDNVFVASHDIDYPTMVLINDIILRYNYSKNEEKKEEDKVEKRKEVDEAWKSICKKEREEREENQNNLKIEAPVEKTPTATEEKEEEFKIN
jgi:hypothetical protein